MCQQPIRGAPCEQTHCGGTLSANPLQWHFTCKPTVVVLYLQTHSGGTLSANPLWWYSISKPTPVVLYLQTHASGTLSANPLQWYSREKYNFQKMIRHCVRSIADVIGHSNIVLHLKYVRSLLAHLRLILFFDML